MILRTSDEKIRDGLIRAVPRTLAITLGLRVLVPGHRLPTPADVVDVGGVAPPPAGWWRPPHHRQDPGSDPTEPYGSESGGKGEDHGWTNCNMTAAATVLNYHLHDPKGTAWGGDMRHHQDDMVEGTDLYDARTAWERYGASIGREPTLYIWSGRGWEGLKQAHKEKRAILLHGGGTMDVPGAGSFGGYHAVTIGPENQEKDGTTRWLFGDPLAGDWQFVAVGDIRAWAEDLDPSIQFAVSKPIQSLDAPPPEEVECCP
jgi:hypothetical protein